MNFRTLDLNLLRVFAAVMVERNVTRAAAQLAMTQPAVSNALRRLREATGDELFVTVPGGVLPTARAEAWWPEVRAALDGLRKLFDPQGFEPARDERSFALAMADATATVLDARARRRAARPPGAQRPARPAARLARPAAAARARRCRSGDRLLSRVADELAAEGRARPLRPRAALRVRVRVRAAQRARARPEPVLTLDAYCAAEHVRVSFAGRPRGFVDEALAALGRTRRVVLTGQPVRDGGARRPRVRPARVLPRSFVPATGLADGLVLRTRRLRCRASTSACSGTAATSTTPARAGCARRSAKSCAGSTSATRSARTTAKAREAVGDPA